ncbi:calcineurin-binding protein cabin-1-like isoform X1 [Polistes fuscatus]|uniref:calcineurin-binding protein cabin-1-like isoform X1 n=1 Tax=Polistes fuscatus TaxID=30207 RepID=UPI001CA921B0|nr:calcineurin-binding protein cabin-1-like isoform X1 [Polistes fuscatus]XP_043487376.1 calcineurin-binding protein cabin-1-like isoform X1 [Polistes fuscatus]
MIKISALNEESSEESEEEDVPTITKEAQEQIALTEYNKALELLRDNKHKEALNIFKELLETELLDEVEKPEVSDGRSRPMLSLKYSCYKNIGAIEAIWGNYGAAIENYWEAANLDDSDVILWYRLGTMAMKISNLELACASFKQGLKCNSNHWPCLDNIITALYAVPDYMNCLLYISLALERDPNYIKGLAYREQIFKSIPCLKECYKLYNSGWRLDPPLYTDYNHMIGEELLVEAEKIAQKWAEVCKSEFIPKSVPELTLRKPINNYTWLDLGESLLDMHRFIVESTLSFVSRIKLIVNMPNVEAVDKNDECDLQETNMDMEIEELQSPNVNVANDIDKDMKIDKEEIVNHAFEGSEINDGLNDVLNTAIDMEIEEDKKSCSTDIQIIEDEDPLRISDLDVLNDVLQFEEPNQAKITELDEPVMSETEGNSEKPQIKKAKIDPYNADNGIIMEKSSDRESDKSNDKIYDKVAENSAEAPKIDEKSNEKTEGKDEVQKVKKRRRSALCFLQQWAWSCSSMRRSARVRSSNRREAERDDVQLEETLRRIFPSTLLSDTVKLTKDDHSKSMDDTMDTMDVYHLFVNQENNTVSGEGTKSSDSSKSPSPDTSQQIKYFGSELENVDVGAFINEYSGKNNLMVIIAKFCEFICTKWAQEWPKRLSDIYLEAYLCTRQHIPHPSPFDEDLDDNILKLNAEMTLLFGELHTDKWLDNKPDLVASSSLDKLGTGMPSEELGYIIFTSIRGDLSNQENIYILLRVLWLKATIFLCQGDTEIVIETLELLLDQLKILESRNHNICLILPNCKCNSQISLKIVEKKLKSIQRSQKLGEIQHLYDEKKYAELSCVLQDTFKFARQKHKLLSANQNIIERDKQLAILLDSLWQLQHYEDCYVWAEACLNESWQNYLNACEDAEQKKWTRSVVNCLEKLEACTKEISVFAVKYLPESCLSRLVQNLVHIVCHQLDIPENALEMPLETVLPWILLHYILQYEEDKERAKSESPYKNKAHNSHNSESDDEDDGIPPSIMILFIAHDFIGKHSWCCFHDAKLLFFTMNLIIPKLETPQFTTIKNKLTKYLEQIFYCLYGHPNRLNKSKPKHLEEHGAPQMELTWEGAQLLFDFYKPKQMPILESPRLAAISIDTELLFKKITRLVPQDSDPNQIIEEMKDYVMGEKEKMPCVKKPLPHSISSIYYLLGDFYFKNNKWTLAARYYLLDLCLRPTGLNSWAGLAMSTGTIIDIWLTNYRLISEDKLLMKAKIAQSSYRHATELAPNHVIIWTEYGSFVYMIHSFCSRLLKQETDTLSMEKFEVLENRKEEMLEIAEQCFQSSNRLFMACHGIDNINKIQDERWLCQYMLGKIAEKKNEDPPIFLSCYAQASKLLYENNAEYPRRISHKNPQYLSIEALEVHYRIHASILKYLEQHEGKPLKKSLGQLFQWHLKNCSEGSFMKFQSKLCEKKKENDSDADTKATVGKDLDNLSETYKNVASVNQRSYSIEEIEIIDRNTQDKNLDGNRTSEILKSESRKRSLDNQSNDNTKRLKLGNISHLQLMQDVVALIDDLITKVCDMVLQKEKVTDDIMVLSSDESNETKYQKKKGESIKNIDINKMQSKEEKNKKNVLDVSKTNIFDSCKKNENVQDLMDALMKQAMEMSQETQQSSFDDDDTRKFEGKWLQNEDLQTTDKETKDKAGDKKRMHISAPKQEATLSRRGSQESTTTTQTTTTTETNNSSSSSSDESSSSEDSSESDSSSDSDSDSVESDIEKKKRDNDITEKEEYMTDEEVATLIAYCLAGLEQCILRFNEHHKSFYRLAHFFFNNRTAKDTTKCKDILLGTYNCQFYPGQSFQGLFADRKSTNFFSGIWHIPNREIDRPGSFASHMSRCVTLLMQVLKETNDSRMLMQLCIQLAKIPDSDKKYLRDSEREQLSRQALTLCLQSLRSRVHTMGSPSTIDSVHLIRTDSRTQVLLDVYKIYQQIQKHFQTKEPTVQAFSSLLIDTYKIYIGNKNLDGNILEMAIKCCQRQILANKIAATSNPGNNTLPTSTASATPATTSQTQVNSTSPQASQNRKPYKNLTSTGRPRGRPPNVNKYLQAMQQGDNMNQFNPKNIFTNYITTPENHALVNPYFMNPLVDPNMLSAMIASLSSNMMAPLPGINYLNRIGNYQEYINRQYQRNLSLSNLTNSLNSTTATVPSSISSIQTMSTSSSSTTTPSSSINNLTNINTLTVQQLLNLTNSTVQNTRSPPTYHQATTTKTATTMSMTKDRPNISITPVSTALPQKSKPSRPTTQTDALPVNIPKSLQISQTSKTSHPSTAQVSLLKPSIIQQVKTSPPKQMTAPQIRVSKSLTEPQPAHNPSLSHAPLKSSNPSNSNIIPQIAHASISQSLNLKPSLPMNLPTSRSGTSLQHKLLSKKNSQRSYPTYTQSSIRKQKPSNKSVPIMSSNFSNMVNNMTGNSSLGQTSFIPAELSGISVSPVTQAGIKPSSIKTTNYKRPPTKPKSGIMDVPNPLSSSFPQATSVEALSMLSQLQQHSHLEIIPQQKNPQIKANVDFSKNLSSSVSVVPQKKLVSEPLRQPNSDCMTLYDLPRGKSAKPVDKSANDSVEIITLDD